MLVNLYVNWEKGTILNEKQAQETIENEYYNDATSDDNFSEWLSENYSPVSLFYMDENDKEGVRTDFMKEAEEIAWDDFAASGYEEVSVEI